MNDIAYKYTLLNKNAKKEVQDFVDFLLSNGESKLNLSISEYKRRILTVSTWSDNDVKIFND